MSHQESHNTQSNIAYAIILAGGSGTRLWPLSRQSLPKQFIPLLGAETLLETTALRLAPTISHENITVITSKASATGEAMVHLAKYAKIIEPCARGTAPAIGIAAINATQQKNDPVLVVLPSDHVVTQVADFQTCLNAAIALANERETRHIVCFGITPTYPGTGYGYIKTDLTSYNQTHKPYVNVLAFKEKPDLVTAESFITEGNYFWNAGIFVARASTLLTAIKSYLPELDIVLSKIQQDIDDGIKFDVAVNSHFADAPTISMDHGVLEKIPSDSAGISLTLVPADIGWSDVGSWDSLYDVSNKDNDANVISGNVLTLNSTNLLINAGKRLVTAIGVDDLNVIDTPDALLITKRGESQNVKAIIELLQLRGSKEHIEHLTVQRPWGSYTVLEDAPSFKVKRINVLPGGRLSLQSHEHRSEHWVVVAGAATITCGEKQVVMHANESIFIPAREKHRLENHGTETITLIEVQVGGYLGEDDIKRYDDVYGRLSK
jgi:mannose-1-phosphate guanylyltransferase / mannose-6-phosphate isomerase